MARYVLQLCINVSWCVAALHDHHAPHLMTCTSLHATILKVEWPGVTSCHLQPTSTNTPVIATVQLADWLLLRHTRTQSYLPQLETAHW